MLNPDAMLCCCCDGSCHGQSSLLLIGMTAVTYALLLTCSHVAATHYRPLRGGRVGRLVSHSRASLVAQTVA